MSAIIGRANSTREDRATKRLDNPKVPRALLEAMHFTLKCSAFVPTETQDAEQMKEQAKCWPKQGYLR